MSFLVNKFRETTSKMKDTRMSSESSMDVCYPTGFLNFDFLNGAVVKVNTGDKEFKYYSYV